jgi:predicted AlkP superfamily pyrophosphatase or phosphodiesterase
LAHVYINDPSKKELIKETLLQTEGIELVLDKKEQKEYHIDHERSGDIVAVADEKSWFTYYYWEDDSKAPDFAHNVDIHNKPGYDPVEMFLDPKKKLIIPRIILKLIGKKLGFRTMMNVIPLDASLVKGSHGRVNLRDEDKAVFIGRHGHTNKIAPDKIHDLILNKIFDK